MASENDMTLNLKDLSLLINALAPYLEENDNGLSAADLDHGNRLMSTLLKAQAKQMPRRMYNVLSNGGILEVRLMEQLNENGDYRVVDVRDDVDGVSDRQLIARNKTWRADAANLVGSAAKAKKLAKIRAAEFERETA